MFEGLRRLRRTLEEVCGLVGDEVACKVLRRIDQTGDDCSSEVSALEQVEEGRRAT